METETQELTLRPDPMLSIIERAVMSPEFDVAKLAELLKVRERWEANEARKAFVVAMNAFKADPPIITKNKHVHYSSSKGDVDYDHPTLDHVCEQVTKALSKHGISYRWAIDDSVQPMKVTCILTHDLGHSEETSMRGAPDETGSKNSLQARGSTVTYLCRYTLMAAAGLASGLPDDDGRGLVTNGDLAEQLEYIANASSADELKRLYKNAYEMFEAQPNALKQIIEARKTKAKEF